MEKASGVSEASSSRDEGAGAGGGLTLGPASWSGWCMADGGVMQGETTSRPLGGGSGTPSIGEVRGGLKYEGAGGSVGEQGYWSPWVSPSESSSVKMLPPSSSGTRGASMAGSVALGGRMLSLAMVAWIELIGISPPRIISCWDSCLK